MNVAITLGTLLLLSASGFALRAKPSPAGPGAVAIAALRCESARDPLGIDTPTPRLSWQLTSDARNQRQTAYRVLAATSPDLLFPFDADLWDSGVVESDQSVHIPYAGKPLSSNQVVYWTVRVWDADDNLSPAAEVAQFTTGILRPEDWHASWITTPQETGRLSPLHPASWIWSPDADTLYNAAARTDPGAVRYFLRRFDLAAAPTAASITITADNTYDLYVNGRKLASDGDWYHPDTHDLAPALRPGPNAVAIAVTNGGDDQNPAGLIARARITLPGGSVIDLPTDASWLASDSAAEFNDGEPADEPGAWRNAQVLGPSGMNPWGVVPQNLPPRTSLPIFRRAFEAAKPVERATLFICGLGHHEAYLNGERIGENILDPTWSFYPKTAFYATHDVTDQIRRGRNALGVLLGKGFYATAGDRRTHHYAVDRPLTLLAQIHLDYADGTSQIIATDESWRWRDGPLTHDSILGGADFDARGLPPGWASPEFDDSFWHAATVTPDHEPDLVAAIAPPLRVMEEFSPRSIDEPEPGIFVYDFGQNASATPRIRVRGRAGQTLRLTYAEQRQGQTDGGNNGRGRVDQAGIGRPAFIQYTLRGDPGGETFSPPFFYSGFQYVELTGAVPAGHANPDALPVVEEMRSLHVRSSADSIGTFECSNKLLNDIDRLIDWSVRSNLSHVLTDCPHREKLGWLEVAYLMWDSIAFRYDLSRFGPKIARDMRDSQGPRGEVYTVAPAYTFFDGGFRYTPEWGAAAAFIPWDVYEWYGDRRVLEDNYESMKRFVDFMRDTSTDLVPRAGLGDWYDYGHGQGLGAAKFTPVELTAMATFAMCADTVSRTADLLRRADDEAAYADLRRRIAERFNALYFDPAKAEYTNFGSPQTANAIALCAGLVPAEHIPAVVDRIVQDIRDRGSQQTAGDVGYHYLVRALSDHGRSDVLFDVNTRRGLGSYARMIDLGWTSLAESWQIDLGVSLNHCMLGHIQEWFCQRLGGIRPDGPGFKTFTIAPEPVGDLTWARATHRSPYGPIASHWTRGGGRFTLDITVPVNTTATVHIPAPDGARILESERPAEDADGVVFLRRERGRVLYEVGSGTYSFAVRPG